MEDMKERTYEIAGKTFKQDEMVYGQSMQLISVLKGLKLPAEALTTDMGALILKLGDTLPMALAVILTEQGQTMKDKDLVELAGWLEFNITNQTTLAVVKDFFDFNPISSIQKEMSGLIDGLRKRIQTRLSGLSSSSVAATSQSETPSSGDSAQGKDAPSLSTEDET